MTTGAAGGEDHRANSVACPGPNCLGSGPKAFTMRRQTRSRAAITNTSPRRIGKAPVSCAYGASAASPSATRHRRAPAVRVTTGITRGRTCARTRRHRGARTPGVIVAAMPRGLRTPTARARALEPGLSRDVGERVVPERKASAYARRPPQHTRSVAVPAPLALVALTINRWRLPCVRPSGQCWTSPMGEYRVVDPRATCRSQVRRRRVNGRSENTPARRPGGRREISGRFDRSDGDFPTGRGDAHLVDFTAQALKRRQIDC